MTVIDSYIGRNYTPSELREKINEVKSALISYVNSKQPTFGDHFIRDPFAVEDFTPSGANGIISSIFPAVAGVESMDIQIPPDTASWFYALSAQYVAEKGFAFYGLDLPQSTPIYAIRMGFGKDQTGGIRYLYNFNGLGGANTPRYVLFKTPFLVTKGDSFWIQFMGVNSNGSTPLLTGAQLMALVDTQTKNPL